MNSKIICRFLILLRVKMIALSLGTEILWDYFCLSLDALVTRLKFRSVVHILMRIKASALA